MARKLSAWNLFVKKIYQEGKSKNKNYEFKQALEDASKRKSEMKNMPSSGVRDATKSKKGRKSYTKVSQKKSRSKNHTYASVGKRGTRKHKRH